MAQMHLLTRIRCLPCVVSILIESNFCKIFGREIPQIEDKELMTDFAEAMMLDYQTFGSILTTKALSRLYSNKMLFERMVRISRKAYRAFLLLCNAMSQDYTTYLSQEWIAIGLNTFLLSHKSKQCLVWFITLDSGNHFKKLIVNFFMKCDDERNYDFHFNNGNRGMNFYILSIIISHKIRKNFHALMTNHKVAKILDRFHNYICKLHQSSLLDNDFSRFRKYCREFLWIQSIESRGRIQCGNPKCRVPYYSHRFGKNENYPGFTIGLETSGIVIYDMYNFICEWYKRMKSTKKTRKWYKCSGCKLVFYCSKRCQKYDWCRSVPTHKFICQKLSIF
eukprot:81743_1